MTWQSAELGNIITLKRGYDLPSKNRINGKVPVYSSSGHSGFHNEVAVRGPGVITGRYGTIGEVFYIEGDYWPLNTTLYVSDFKGNYPHFIYYLLKTINWSNYTTASAVPGINRNHVHHCVVTIPDLTTQHKIANVLGTYDQQIDYLTQINGHLLELLMTKYRNVTNSIDTYGCIEDLGIVVGGATPSKKREEFFTASGISWVTPKDLSNTTNIFIKHGATDITDAGYQSCSTKLMPAGSVLFSSRAPVGYVAIAAKEVCTNQGFKSVVPSNNIGTAFVFCFLRDNAKEIEKTGSGTTFVEVSGRAMRHFVAPIPSTEQAQLFSSYAEPLLNAIKNNENEISILTQLRDALLPKLMSGEIDVSKVELPTPPAQSAHANGRLSD